MSRRRRLIAVAVILTIAAIGLVSLARAPAAFAGVPGALELRSLMKAGYYKAAYYSKTAYYFGFDHQCNICGRQLRTFNRGKATQNELECPFCMSRPRHRTAFIYFNQRTDIFEAKPKRMLHVAPEPSLGPKFRSARSVDYLSADLDPSSAMVQMDITDIHLTDNSFDVIYCSHVLEHIPDDRKAMRELARVLKPGGWAILAVPILRTDKTFEDPNIKTAMDRERIYGQSDHVRMYGPDFVDRLRESGFDVTVDHFASSFSDSMVRRYGLSREDIYVCRKREAARI